MLYCYCSTIEQYGLDRAVAMANQKKNDAINITEDELDVMWLIHKEPSMSQRRMAYRLGLSLGKINYCLGALVDIGFIKLENFKNSNSKTGYLYLLTTKGVKAKLEITKKFIKNKQIEYDKLNNYLNG
jgi:EPS-associated MarR family transcriptional regulator